MTYQFLFNWLEFLSNKLQPTIKKYKLTLDYNSYRMLIIDVNNLFWHNNSNIKTGHTLNIIITQFGEVEIVVKDTVELYQKLELKS